MYNRRILISEDEKSRILGLHENRRMKEWGIINEADTSKTVAAYGTVEACKAAYNKEYLSGISQKVTGQNWKVIQKKYLEAKCNGKTPCDTGAASNKNLAMEICEGTFTIAGASGAAAGGVTTTSSATGTTFYIDGKPTPLNTDQEISDMVKTKKITQDTFVFKSPEIPKPTKISDLPEDSPIKKAVMAIIATVPPELPGETKTFKISPDGKQPAKDYTAEQLTAASKDGSLTQTAFVVVTDQATGKSTYQSIMQNAEASKIVNLAAGPEALKSEIASSGNPALDAWLKTPSGQTYLSKPDQKSKEAYIDYLEQTKDPIIAQIGGKDALRKILLGDVNKDTKFGRFLQNVGNRTRNVGKAITGKEVTYNTGYNPNQPK
jgi:hypothetical protein